MSVSVDAGVEYNRRLLVFMDRKESEHMVYDVTIQIRVLDLAQAQKWYTIWLQRKPDFIPHEGFVEWELFPGCWLQVAEGTPSVQSGPLRLGIENLEAERDRIMQALDVEPFDIHVRQGVPVKWGTFSDPWGNLIGYYEYVNEQEKEKRIRELAVLKEHRSN